MEIRRYQERDFGPLLGVINAAAERYRGVIPADCWREPYMPAEELTAELRQGVMFWVADEAGDLAGAMGLQDKGEVTLVRHAYVAPAFQRRGVGALLLRQLETLTPKTILIGTWAAAAWAIAFYRKHGYALIDEPRKSELLQRFWSIPARQVEASVVLIKPPPH